MERTMKSLKGWGVSAFLGRHAALQSVLGVLTLLFFSVTLLSQRPERIHPPENSHELYLLFFSFQENFAVWTQDRILADPDHRTRILASSSKYLGVTNADHNSNHG
jgi:hypothetical protein